MSVSRSIHHAAPVVRALHARAGVMMLPRQAADALSLHYHLSLAVLDAGHGSHHHLSYVTQILMLTYVLVEAGYGEYPSAEFLSAMNGASAAFARGQQAGEWFLERETADRFAAILMLHDQQLLSVPVADIAIASDRAAAMSGM
ncbi:hypothetical protein R52603_03088 [Paraburkholderia saeva]|nr:hypothetical protein R52603_03088 [Paraburkholderia saeva]